MTISERQRHILHQTLDELMGPDVASTAMELLPPVGWGDVATKHDLAELEDRLTTRFDAALTDLRSEVLSELHTEIGSLRTELHGGIGSLRTELHTGIGSLRAEFQRDLRTEIGSLRTELHDSLQSMTRTYVMGNVGLVFTVAAIAFGAARLV